MENDKLNEWNQQIAKRLIINDIFLVIYVLIGFFSNLLVILVYKYCFNGIKEERYFIPWLAVLDFFASTLRSSFELIRKILPVMIHGGVFCKLVWLPINVFAFSSMLLLLVIAIHRYLKVCRPFGRQMTLRWKRILLFAVFVLSVAASAVLNVYNTDVEVFNEKLNITGSECDIVISNSIGVGFYIFVSFATILALVIAVGLLLFYSLIGRTIYIQRKMRNTITRKHDCGFTAEEVSMASACYRMKSHRFSYMLMAIAVGFILSYTPQFVILFWEIKEKRFLFDRYDKYTPLVLLLRELTIVNHIINPFIYGFYDRTFRREVKKFLNRMSNRTH